MGKSNNRVFLYDNLKFILMLLVVIGHFAMMYVETSEFFLKMVVFIYFFHMPAFIFISGLFSKRAVNDKDTTIKRVRYFLIIYVVLKILFCLQVYLLQHKFELNLLVADSLPWFMLLMAYFYGITYLLRDVDGKLVLVISITLGCVAGYFDFINDFLCLSRTIVYYPFFYLGYLMDRNEIVEKTELPLARIIGAVVIIGFAYLCFFQRDLVWTVNPLFSARRPFSALTYPATGGLQRLCYYPAVMLFITSLISLAPRKESIMTVFGQHTLRVYCVHYFIISFLSHWKVFERLPVLLPDIIWQLTVIGMAIAVTVILSLPMGERKRESRTN